MAENSVVEKQFCEACGADIRSEALFCYSCGQSVTGETVAETQDLSKNNISDAWFRGEITSGAKTNNLNAENLTEKKSAKEKPKNKKSANTQIKQDKPKIPVPQPGESEKLKTAASIRQKSRVKTFKKKQIEVAWEEPEASSNILFIAVSIILTLLAGAALLAMLWIR